MICRVTKSCRVLKRTQGVRRCLGGANARRLDRKETEKMVVFEVFTQGGQYTTVCEYPSSWIDFQPLFSKWTRGVFVVEGGDPWLKSLSCKKLGGVKTLSFQILGDVKISLLNFTRFCLFLTIVHVKIKLCELFTCKFLHFACVLSTFVNYLCSLVLSIYAVSFKTAYENQVY